MDLSSAIRSIPDFPKPGIMFRDITTLLSNPEAFRYSLDQWEERYKDQNLSAIIAIESRGFFFASPLCDRMSLPLIPVRKPGKLPSETYSQSYELEYGTDTLEIHKDALKKGDRVIIIDDLLATGGTAEAAVKLVQQLEAEIVEAAFVIELVDLKGREKISVPIHSLVSFEGE